VLDAAAAALAEVSADRRSTLRAWLKDAKQPPSLAFDLHGDTFAGKRKRNEDGLAINVDNSVPLRTQAPD
jgi:hypothetical protein